VFLRQFSALFEVYLKVELEGVFQKKIGLISKYFGIQFKGDKRPYFTTW
jgi:hypothetical protein